MLIHHLGHFAEAGHHLHHRAHAAHLAELFHLREQIVKVELAFLELLRHFLRIFAVDRLRCFLHEGDNIAHAEDTLRDPVGVERLQRVPFLANPHKLNGLARDRTHRERGAAAAIAIDAGQHNASEANLFVKGLCGLHGVLAGHRIGHKERLNRVCEVLDRGGLRHHFFIDGQAASRIEHDEVIALLARCIHRTLGDVQRLLALHDRKRRNARLLAQLLQLLLRGGAVNVQRRHQHFLIVLLRDPFRDFCGGGCFTRALQTDHQIRARRGREPKLLRIAAEHLNQCVIDDFDELLTRIDAFDEVLANRFVFDLFDEIFDNGQSDVGLEQRNTDLTAHNHDIVFAQAALAAQLIED